MIVYRYPSKTQRCKTRMLRVERNTGLQHHKASGRYGNTGTCAYKKTAHQEKSTPAREWKNKRQQFWQSNSVFLSRQQGCLGVKLMERHCTVTPAAARM